MNALVLVDIQNDFVPGGALAVPEGDRIVPLVNELQEHFALVIATQDWHPVNHGSFAANHVGKKPGDIVDLGGLPQILWPIHCVQGSAGADFVPTLDRSRFDHTFVKGTDPGIDSYSAFFDNGHRQSTGLAEYLRGKGVTDIYLAGLATDYCVKYTAFDAVESGFKVHVIEDACRGVELQPGDVGAALEEMRAVGADVVTSGEVMSRLNEIP
jgi:nicotinamidase/pyrazinamidase